MNKEQLKAAEKAMIEWLSHPGELGKEPFKIECTKEFDLHDLHYYIFRFKEKFLGEWILGVCGGYEDNSLDHCGHVYSDLKKYDEMTALEDAVAIVERIRAYWMERARKQEELLAAYNHLAVFLCWMVEHDFIHEQLMGQIPNLKEMVRDTSVDLRNVIATHPAFGGGLKSYHFKESILPFIRKFYVFNREGYPSCVDHYALSVLGKEKYNCKEYKNEAYMFVPYNETYYKGLSKYIDKAFEKHLK